MESNPRRATRRRRLENGAGYITLSCLAIIPVLEIVVRICGGMTIAGVADLVSHLTILVTLAGCLLTTRESKHLAVSAAIDRLHGPAKGYLQALTAFFSVFVISALFWTSVCFLEVFISGYHNHQLKIAFIPRLYFILWIPVTFFLIACRLVRQAPAGFIGLMASVAGMLFGTFLCLPSLLYFLSNLVAGTHPELYLYLDDLLFRIQGIQVEMMSVAKLPLILLLIFAAFWGTPIFVVLGGIAFFLYTANAEPLTSVIDEAYKSLTSVGIPAIPLFTLTGFILSESRAGERFLRLFKAFLGWLPGGYGVAGVLILAFFTTFTGASGITILALGGLLSYILLQNNYKEKFSLGLITASGSVGLLFPPSLPLILFGIVAQFILKDWILTHPSAAGMMQAMKLSNLFLAGLIPGLLLVVTLSAMAVFHGLRSGAPKFHFQLDEAGKSLWSAAWELLLPLIVIVLFLTGLITITEVGAISVLYIFIVEVLIHRDIRLRALPGILYKTLVIVGGILIILAISKGLAQYIIIEQIPDAIAAWMQAHVHSKFLFLLLLNIALLITGCFLDIYSAIAVVAPIVIPVGLAYGVHPVHLGIIFLSNLELGYLTPPVGLNLFMSAYRFEKPVGAVYRSIVPFLLALLVSVLLITYIPWLTMAFIKG